MFFYNWGFFNNRLDKLLSIYGDSIKLCAFVVKENIFILVVYTGKSEMIEVGESAFEW